MRLSTRIALHFAGLALVFGLLSITAVALVLDREQSNIEAYIAALLAGGLADPLARDVINEDPISARQTLQAITQQSSDYAFAYIIGFDGELFAHTFDHGFPRGLLRPFPLPEQERFRIVRLAGAGDVQEVPVVLIPGMRARLYLGIDSAVLESEIDAVLGLLALAFLAGSMILILAGWYAGRRIAAPLTRIAEFLAMLRPGQPPVPLAIAAGGREDRQLLGAINRMQTAEFEAQAALRASQERYRGLVEGSVQGIVIHRDFKPLFANEAFAQIFGYPSAEAVLALPDLCSTFVAEADLEWTRQQYGAPPAGGQISFEIERRARRADGSVIWVEARGSRVPWDGGWAAMATFVDITERKQAEQALRESQERLSLFMDSSTDFYTLVDRDLKVLDVDRKTLRLQGYEHKEQVLGRNLADLMSTEAEGDLELLREVIRSGRPQTREARLAAPGAEGRELWLLQNAFPVGQDLGLVLTDITARKEAELEIQALNLRLEERVRERTAELKAAQAELVRSEKMATLGQLTATVSHELRNPLGTIQASVFNLRGLLEDQANPNLNRSLERIARNVTRCDNIINDLLDFSRTKASRPLPTELDLWLGELLAEQRLPKWLWLEFTGGAEGIVIELDQDRFRRAVINLVDNAVQAMAHAREQEPDHDARLTVCTRTQGGRAEIVVTDTGPGMSEEVVDHIFEPLFSTKTYGVGLGLPTVRQIMDQEKGGIQVSSSPGAGTEMLLWLPLGSRYGEGASS